MRSGSHGEPRYGHLVGKGCPKFRVCEASGETVGEGDLSGVLTLLVFYPFAFTPICDAELTELDSRIREFDDVAILAISCDPPAAVRAFQQREDFAFEMASDFWPHGAAAAAFDVFDTETGTARRASFVLSPGGEVLWSVINPAGQARPVQSYLDALAPHRAGRPA